VNSYQVQPNAPIQLARYQCEDTSGIAKQEVPLLKLCHHAPIARPETLESKYNVKKIEPPRVSYN
jgi:hypothetical protein